MAIDRLQPGAAAGAAASHHSEHHHHVTEGSQSFAPDKQNQHDLSRSRQLRSAALKLL